MEYVSAWDPHDLISNIEIIFAYRAVLIWTLGQALLGEYYPRKTLDHHIGRGNGTLRTSSLHELFEDLIEALFCHDIIADIRPTRRHHSVVGDDLHESADEVWSGHGIIRTVPLTTRSSRRSGKSRKE